MSQNLYKFVFVILIVAIWSESVEISFIAAFITAFTAFSSKISKAAFTFLFLLSILVLIGIVSAISLELELYPFIKDTIYFIRPMLIFFAAYLIVTKLKNKSDFFDIIIYTGFAFAFIHLAKIAINFGSIGPRLDKLRGVYGRSSHLELVALYLVTCVKSIKNFTSLSKIIYRIFIAILAVSFFVYFSRTMLVVYVLMVLAHYGLLKLNIRGIIALFVGAIFAGMFIFYIKDYEEPKDPGILDTFLAKVKNSYDEAFKTKDFDVTLNDRRELWGNWRAYEAEQVIKKIHREKSWVLGAGFGSTVDVGLEVRLDGEMIQHLPKVHNGLAYVYLKVGALGILIYLIAIFYMYYFYYKDKKGDENSKLYNRILVSGSFYLLVTSFVVTGIFVSYDMATLLIGGTFAIKHFSEN